MSSDTRCHSCGALVAADAEWCGQCYASLGPSRAERPSESGSAAALPIQATEGEPAWACPVCGHRNQIELNHCAVCGTPFARLFQQPERRPRTAPKDAAVWSLLIPGLGHWRSGRPMEGLARIVLFVWMIGTLLVLLVSRFGKGGLGPASSLVFLFLIASALVYSESAVDAYRTAAGDPPLVSSRALLWGAVALVLLSVLLGSVVVLPAARGG